MAIEDERGQQQLEAEDEMGILRRCGSASPSTLSTASSGSPLVRNSSSSSGALKRPAPTSIAAAQLQCQQQIEFANRLATSGEKSTLSAMQVANGISSAKTSKAPSYSVDHSKKGRDESANKMGNFNGNCNSNNNSSSNKSLGYNLAKSIAFKAYSINEPVRKLRYINLACLLLTLVCLVTILIFNGSGSDGNSGGWPAGAVKSQQLPLLSRQQQQVATRKSLLTTTAGGNGAPSMDDNTPANDDSDDEDETSESIESLNSQPLLDGSLDKPAATTTIAEGGSPPNQEIHYSQNQRQPAAALEREITLSAEFERVPNVIDEQATTQSTLTAAGGQTQSAVAITTTTVAPSTEQQQQSATAEASSLSFADESKDDKGPVSLLNDPFLNSTFTKSELRSLSKLLKRSNGKPVTIRGKSGATITMRSNSNFDTSQLSPIPSFIERQLQLGSFKPSAQLFGKSSLSTLLTSSPSFTSTSISDVGKSVSSGGNQAASNFIESGGSEGPNFVSTIRSSAFALPNRLYHQHSHHRQQPEIFMEPMSMIMAPMLEQMLRPSPLAMPGSLMKMIMRADSPLQLDEQRPNGDDESSSAAQPSTDDLAQATFSRTVILPQASLTIVAGGLDGSPSNNNSTNGDTSASQNSNQAKAASLKPDSNSTTTSPSSPSSPSASKQLHGGPMIDGNNNNSEIETFDVSHLAKPSPIVGARFDSSYPRSSSSMVHSPHSGSSMIIFGPGDIESGRRPDNPFQLSPFGPGAELSPLMAMPQFAMAPQIMMLGSGGPFDGGLGTAQGRNPLYPILGSLLTNVMADLALSSLPLSLRQAERTKGNKTDLRNQQELTPQHQASGSSLAPNWAALSLSSPNSLFSTENEWAASPGSASDSADSWDEHSSQHQQQQQSTSAISEQLKARHREAEGDLDSGADASDITAGALNSRLTTNGGLSSFGTSMFNLPGIVSGSIRQTIRGPGMTAERIIEIPTARLTPPVGQQLGEGIRSQSLKRIDTDDSLSNVHSSSSSLMANQIGHGPMISPLGSFFFRHANDRAATGDEFPSFPLPHPVGALGRILSDLAQSRSDGRLSGGAPPDGFALIKNRSVDLASDYFDEGADSSPSGDEMFTSTSAAQQKLSQQRPPSSGQIRVASARFIVRPFESSAHESGLFIPPTRFTMPDIIGSTNNNNVEHNAALERELSGPNSGGQESGESRLATPSFEDTLNSMEDRVNHVLSLSAQHLNANGNRQRTFDELKVVGAASDRPMAIQAKISAASTSTQHQAIPNSSKLISSLSTANTAHTGSTHSASTLDRPNGIDRSDSEQSSRMPSRVSGLLGNPFTSPSSPLFGFPTSSMASFLGNQKSTESGKNKPNKDTVGVKSSSSNINVAAAADAGSNRQQKSFTYHSNNELAGGLHKRHQQQQSELTMEDSNQQSVFMPFDSLAAALPSMVFGRRMDDVPEQFRIPQPELFLRRET